MTRGQPEEFTVRPPRRLRTPLPPAASLVVAFATLIGVGTVLLMLPWATASGEPTRFIDALFTATSATCVTGLVVLDTGTYWSAFGQIVIMLLIQLGGFGIMASSTLLLVLLVGRRSRLRDRVAVQESLGGIQVGNVTTLVRRIAVFTIGVELAGALVLATRFTLGSEAGGEGNPLGLWWGLFHAISGFNNAGFDLTGGFQSLRPFVHDWVVLVTFGLLLVIGGIGFAIVSDTLRVRQWRKFALETKIVLAVTGALIVVGTVGIALSEWSNPATLGALPAEQRILNALFESATLRTAGFTALSTGALLEPTLFLVIALMFIGGASGSTAGGIKVTTFGVLLIAITSTARGLPSAQAFGRRIPHVIVYRALAVAFLSVAFVFMMGMAYSLMTDARFLEVLFEAVSAFGTVGASTGLTSNMPDPARLLTVVAMFAGRLGPLTLVVALAMRARPVPFRPASEAVRIG